MIDLPLLSHYSPPSRKYSLLSAKLGGHTKMEKSNLVGSMLSSKPAAEQSALTSSFTPSSHNAPFPISSFTYRKPTSSSLTPSTVSVSSCSGLSRSKSSHVTSQSKCQAKVASQQSQYVSSASSYGSQQPMYSALVTASRNTYPSQMGYSSHTTVSYSSNSTGYSNQQNVYSGSTETTQGSMSRSKAAAKQKVKAAKQSVKAAKKTKKGSMLNSKAAAEQSALTSSFTPSSLNTPSSYSSYSSQIVTSSSLTPSTVSGYSYSALFWSASTQGTSQSKYQAHVASQQSQYVCSESSYGSQQPAYSSLVTASGNTFPSQSGYSSHTTASYSSNNTDYSNQQNVYNGSTETTTHGSMLSSPARYIHSVLPADFIISSRHAPFPFSPFTTSCLAPSTVSGDNSLVPSLQPQYVSSASSYGLQQSVASVTTSGNTYSFQTDSSEDSQDSFSTELQNIFIKKLAEEESVSDFNQKEDKQTEESLNDLGDQSVTSKKDEEKHMDF